MNAKRLHVLSVACLLSVASAHAADDDKVPKSAHPLPLWKVEGQKSTVYLLGSVHFLKAGDYPLAGPIESAYSNAQVVVFETDMGAMESMKVQAKMASKSQLPADQTMRDWLSPEVYINFEKHASATGLPPALFDRLKPSVAAVAVVALEMQKMGFDPAYGVDQHFFNRAQKDGKQIVPLETVDFQIGLITDLTKEEAGLMVRTLLADFDNVRNEIKTLMQAWQQGDTVKLEKLLNEATREAPGIYRRFVTDRNERWVPKIEELARGDKPAIVIVGAGHLVGQDGVVNLLKKRGLTLTQM